MTILASLSVFLEQHRAGRITTGRELRERIDALGVDGVEVPLRLVNSPEHRDLLSDLDGSHVTCHSHHWDFTLAANNEYVREACIRQLCREIELSKQFGALVLTFHPGFQGQKRSREESHDVLIDSIHTVTRTCAGMLDEGTLILAIENMDSDERKLCRSADELDYVLSACPGIGLTLDLAHCAMNGFEISLFIRRLAARIRHVHVSGYVPGTPHGQVSLPRSTVNLAPYIAELARANLAFCIENRNLALAEESRSFLQAVTAQA